MPIQARVAAAAVIGVLVVGGALMYIGRGVSRMSEDPVLALRHPHLRIQRRRSA